MATLTDDDLIGLYPKDDAYSDVAKMVSDLDDSNAMKVIVDRSGGWGYAAVIMVQLEEYRFSIPLPELDQVGDEIIDSAMQFATMCLNVIDDDILTKHQTRNN